MNIRIRNESGPPTRLWPALAGVAATVAALVVLGRVWSAVRETRLANAWTATAAVAVAVGLAAQFRRPILRWLTSLPFSAGLLGAILLATGLGTLIVQGAPAETVDAKYGHALAAAMRATGLDDIFHAFAFRGLLALLSLSLALVVVDRRGWRPSEWFFTLNHAGIVVILLGGLIGTLAGAKGFIDLREGQTARSFVRHDRFGRPTGEQVPLDFRLRLDKFEIERLPPEYRIYVYAKDGDRSWRPVSSRGLAEATRWSRAGDSGAEFRLLAAYPDFEMKSELRDTPDGRGPPAVQLQAVDREGHISVFTLLAGVEGHDGVFFRESRTLLRFAWEESRVAISTEVAPERHVLFYRSALGAGAYQEVEVKPGETRMLGGSTEVKVLAWYPDFALDEKKEGTSRSPEPRNPALKVSVRSPEGEAREVYVFANHPEFSGEDGTPAGSLRLKYGFEPEKKPADREFVLIGKTGELVEYRKGVLKQRAPLPEKNAERLAPGVPATVKKLSASAEEVHMAVTRSRTWRHPVAEVEVKSGGAVEKRFLKLAMPSVVGDGRFVLTFQPKPDDVKSYRSQVSVVVEGEPVRRETISVNHPLSFGGYRFYQSNFHREDPTYSGILVVKDPGLPFAYAGFLMICLGAIGRFYLQPWLQRRRQAPVA